MSWHNELAPPQPTLTDLGKTLGKASKDYRRAGLPPLEMLAFLSLRTIQWIAYGMGWWSKVDARRELP